MIHELSLEQIFPRDSSDCPLLIIIPPILRTHQHWSMRAIALNQPRHCHILGINWDFISDPMLGYLKSKEDFEEVTTIS
jgi:hypothetical protein